MDWQDQAALATGAPKLSKDGRIPPLPAIATHDEKRILFAKQYAEKVDLPNTAMEFQMLYGIRRDLNSLSEVYPATNTLSGPARKKETLKELIKESPDFVPAPASPSIFFASTV